MRVLFAASALAFTLCLTPAYGVAHASQAALGQVQLTTSFSVDSATQIPGRTLKPGKYTMNIVDHLADRTIMRVNDDKGKVEATFLALPNPHLANGHASGPILWSKGPHKTAALRGYAFPGTAVEFVYPKEDAVEIAKVNTEKVPAIDPASEGRPVSSKMSEDDRRMVVLWTLSSTRVGPADNSQPAIQAERYQPAPDAVQNAQQTTAAPAASNTASVSPEEQPQAKVQRRRPSANQQVASVKRPDVISALPHTASPLPLVLLIGFVALICAAGMRIMRGLRA